MITTTRPYDWALDTVHQALRENMLGEQPGLLPHDTQHLIAACQALLNYDRLYGGTLTASVALEALRLLMSRVSSGLHTHSLLQSHRLGN